MKSLLISSGRLPIGRLTAAVVAFALVPLALLTYFSLTLSSEAVGKEVEKRLQATASLSGSVVNQELSGLSDLVESYADRPNLVRSLEDGNQTQIVHHLRELRAARGGIYTTFMARPDGTLVQIVPLTPSIVGKNFAFRNWYRGVTSTGLPYVSELYRTQATGRPLVVAAAALVRDETGNPIGILVAAYGIGHVQQITDDIARAQGVVLKVTDQRGNLVAQPGGVTELTSRRADPRVGAALEGGDGITTVDTPDGHRVSAYAPVASFGWTVTSSVPSDTAFAAVSELRSAVLSVAAVLAALLLGGGILLLRTLVARRNAEEGARRQAGINEAVLEATTEGIALVAPDGRVAVANSAFERMLGDMLGEAVSLSAEGLPLRELAAGVAERTADPDAYRSDVAALAEDTQRIALDAFEIRETGQAFQRYVAPVADSAGRPLGRVVVLRDVTAEREGDRLKADLLSTVSHELRTPLTGILGFAELLVSHDTDQETRERYLRTIHSEAMRLTALITDFLDLQRIEEGHLRLSLEAFDLREVLSREAELFGGQSRQHRLELRTPEEPLRVVGDRERLTQVLANLLSNAIKYSPAGGQVEVASEHRNGMIRISVSDTGIGIPSDQQRHLFQKFFRVDSSDTREIGGTGLGLALSREIVEAHSGRMGFESVEGEGSTFWLELPSGAARAQGGRGRVLVIEDDPVAAELLAAQLRAEGYAVENVSTGEEGLARVAEDPPAVVCLDIDLPGDLDGWQVLGRLKADPSTAAVPVVVCTGGNGRGKAATLGAADFLTKPFSAEQLRETMKRVLPRKSGLVLVADDEATVRRLVGDTLAGRYELAEAADGVEALEAIAERRPDAVVLDLMMPRLDGFAVLERLQEDPDLRTIPVVVLTARQLTANDRRMLSAQAVALLEKGFYSQQELVGLIAQAMARSGDGEASNQQ
jgi:signal transduction histidine kinase/DNA-binding response OmpR family regulator